MTCHDASSESRLQHQGSGEDKGKKSSLLHSNDSLGAVLCHHMKNTDDTSKDLLTQKLAATINCIGIWPEPILALLRGVILIRGSTLQHPHMRSYPLPESYKTTGSPLLSH